MIGWIRRLSAMCAGLILFGGFAVHKEWALATISLTVNLLWTVDSLLPRRGRAAMNSLLLVIESFLIAGSLVFGAVTWRLVLAAGLALMCWNAGVFLQGWADPPSPVRNRYLGTLAVTVGFGTAAGVFAFLLGGSLWAGFPALFILVLAAGILMRRLLSGSARKNGRSPGGVERPESSHI